MDSSSGKSIRNRFGDLLGTPRVSPPSVSSSSVPATSPLHLRARHQLAVGAGDNTAETILHILTLGVVRGQFGTFGRLARRSAFQWGVGWVSIIAMGIGYLLLMSSLRHISPGPMGVVATSEPIVGTLTAWMALSQAVSLTETIGVL